MDIMTSIGPVSAAHVHDALKYDIQSMDPGIGIVPIEMDWGSLVTLTRQGQSTRWRVFFFKDGTSKLSHLETATLPGVDLVFESGEHLNLRDTVTYFIDRGWI